MTNSIALGLVIVIGTLVAADWIFNEAEGLVFLGRRLLDLISYVAFWR